MSHARAVFLLFFLNFVDAILTIVWVTGDMATEANILMAALLDWGVLPFLAVKITIGAAAGFVLMYASEYRVARIGVTVALSVYILVMASHVLTGLAVSGYI